MARYSMPRELKIRQASGREVFARPLYLRRLEFTANQAPAAVIPQGGRKMERRNSKRRPELDDVPRANGPRQHIEKPACRARDWKRLVLQLSIVLAIVSTIVSRRSQACTL